MRVTIITATFNSATTLRDTLMSVARQTYKNIEHIIIDGGSIDDTLAIAESFKHVHTIISEPDKGIYDAMNKGINLATGDIIGILNSDDFFPNIYVLERIVKSFQEQNCDATYGDLNYVNRDNTAIIKRKWIAGGYSRNLFYRGWMPPHPTFYVKRSCYEKYGLFNLSFKVAADYDILLRFLFVNHINAFYIPAVLVHMRAGGISNASFRQRIGTHLEDHRVWKINEQKPKWYTLAFKPLRKIKQFILPNVKLLGNPGKSSYEKMQAPIITFKYPDEQCLHPYSEKNHQK
ncbi:MAG: glycosyltransferase [Filimonas sp.]|nr:glycosyltransferase [Filimonas sp.]